MDKVRAFSREASSLFHPLSVSGRSKIFLTDLKKIEDETSAKMPPRMAAFLNAIKSHEHLKEITNICVIGLGDLEGPYERGEHARKQLESGEGPAGALAKKKEQEHEDNHWARSQEYWTRLYQLDFLRRIVEAIGKKIVINDYDPSFDKDTKDVHKHVFRDHTIHVEDKRAPLNSLVDKNTFWYDANTEKSAIPEGFTGNNAPLIITGHVDFRDFGNEYDKHVQALKAHVPKEYTKTVSPQSDVKAEEPPDVEASAFSALFVRKA